MTREGLICIGILIILWILLNVLSICLSFSDRAKVILNSVIGGITILVSLVQFVQGVPEPTIYSDYEDGQLIVSIENEIPLCKHFYSTDTDANAEDYLLYSDPFYVDEGITVYAYSKFWVFKSKIKNQIVPNLENQNPALKFDASLEISGNMDRKFHLEITAPEKTVQNDLFPGFENSFVRFSETDLAGIGVGNACISFTVNDQVTEKTHSYIREIQNPGRFPGSGGPPEPNGPPPQNDNSGAQFGPWSSNIPPSYSNISSGYMTFYTPIGDITIGKDDLRSRMKDGHLEMDLEILEGTNEFWVDFNMTANGRNIPSIINGVILEIYGVASSAGSYALLEDENIIQKSVARESEVMLTWLNPPSSMQGPTPPEGESVPPERGGMPPGSEPPPLPKSYSIIIPLFPFTSPAHVQIKDSNEYKKFTDIDYLGYVDAVAYAYSHGLLIGTANTTFNPNGSVKLSTFVTVLHRLEGQPPSLGNYGTPNEWYKDAADWARDKGIVKGNGGFDSESIVTQRKCLQMLWRYDKNRTEEIDDDALLIWNYQLDLLNAQAINLNSELNRAQLALVIRNYCIATATSKKDAPSY